MHIIGVDFTSSPRKAKPITVAHAVMEGPDLRLQHLSLCPDWASYEHWLAQPGPWVGAFDFPFGLSRELVEHLAWPQDWAGLVRHCARMSRSELRAVFKAYCDARPAGSKFAHRATDRPAGSSPSMKWVNPPVAYMFHEGTRRLLDAGVTVYGLHAGDPQRVALEGYPGLLARAVTRASYKSDERARQTVARRDARAEILEALRDGSHPFGVRVLMTRSLASQLLEDASADLLDAVLCAVAAAWAARRPGYGMPEHMDPVEGWTAGAAHGGIIQARQD